MNKKKIIGLAGAVVVCILVFVFIVIRGKSPNPAENPVEMLGRIENALGDEYKKQSMTELVATLKYGCLLYTSPSPRDISGSRMPSSA